MIKEEYDKDDPQFYILKEGAYRVTIRIYEASDLIPKKVNGSANPFCYVTVGNQSNSTEEKKQTLSPLWDKIMNFQFTYLKKSQLEEMKIKFEIVDKDFVIFQEHLGGYEIDLTSVYFNKNHMFYRTWFTLFDFNEKLEGCMGYIKADIEVLGPDDEPTIMESITDDPTAEKTIISSKIKPNGHLIMSEIYRAEYLSPVGITDRQLDPYVRIKYGGIYKDTKSTETTQSANPEFNQIIFLPAILPNHSKDVFIEIWHKSSLLGKLLSDTLIGVTKIPFNRFKNSDNYKPTWFNIYGPSLTSHNEYTDLMTRNGYKIGTTFRGRILLRFSSRDDKHPQSDIIMMKYKIPQIVIPNPLQKVYTLRLDIFEGSVLPTESKGLLHFQIGPYIMKTAMKEKDENGNIYWKQSLDERRLSFPLDFTQIPDLIIYFCDQDVESHRISYCRLPAEKFVVYNNKSQKVISNPMIIKFKEEKSHQRLKSDKFPGFVVLRAMLYAFTPPPRKESLIIMSTKQKTETYKLIIFVYVARNLASGDDSGISNPYVFFKVGGQKARSKCKKNTLNPNFKQKVEMLINIDESQNASPPTMMVMMYHKKDSNQTQNYSEENSVFLGRYWLLLETFKTAKINNNKKYYYINEKEKIELVYVKPKWFPMIYDKKSQIDGKLLMGYIMVKQSVYDKHRKIFDVLDIDPETSRETLSIYSFGLRDIHLYQKDQKKQIKKFTYDIIINGEKIMEQGQVNQQNDDKEKNKQSIIQKNEEENNGIKILNINQEFIDKYELKDQKAIEEEQKKENDKKKKIKKNPVNVLDYRIDEYITFDLDVPYIKELCPIMEIFIYEEYNNKLLGIGQYELSKPLGYFYKEEDDRQYMKRWYDFLQLGKIQKNYEEVENKNNLKIQQFSHENKILYLQNQRFVIKQEISARSKIYSSVLEFQHIQVGEYQDFEQYQQNNNRKNQQNIFLQRESFWKYFQLKFILDPDKNPELQEYEQGFQNNLYLYENQDNDLKNNFANQIIAKKLYNNKYLLDDIQEEKINFLEIQADQQGRVFYKQTEDQQQNEIQINVKKVEKSKTVEAQAMVETSDILKMQLRPKEDIMREEESLLAESDEISNFQLSQDQEIHSVEGELSVKNFKFEELFEEENYDAKIHQRKTEIQKWYSKIKIKNPLKGLFKKKKDQEIEYVDYDTDEDEEFDDILPYLKGRREYQDDLEDCIFENRPRNVESCFIYCGNQRKEGGFRTSLNDERFKVGKFKFLFLRPDRSDLIPVKKIRGFLEKLKKPKEHLIRVYILRGLGITSISDESNPKTYLRITLNNKQIQIDKEGLREGPFPEYYRTFEFYNIQLPGTAILKIEILEKKSIVKQEILLGYTEIDLEERMFSYNWSKQEKKPVEKRNILNDIAGSRGRLEMWIDVLPINTREPITVIFPKEQIPFELRVIVWQTKDCVFKDEITKCNDLFARGGVKRGDHFMETDTHWRCRNKGSFNWRWKHQIMLPIDENKNYGEDKYEIQLWDRDIISRNDLIGYLDIDLNQHKMLKKSYSRKQQVEMRLRQKGSGQETNQIWYEVFHPEKVDVYGNKISQGKVQLSFEAMPMDLCEKFENGFGRASPNFFPTLPEPVGRFTFDLFSPCATLKSIIGPDLYYKLIYTICCLLFTIIFIFVGYYVLTTYLGVKVASFQLIIIQ